MAQQPQFARQFGRPTAPTAPAAQASVNAMGQVVNPDGTVMIDPATNQPVQVQVTQTGMQTVPQQGVPVTNLQPAPKAVQIPSFDNNGMQLVDAAGNPVMQTVPADSPAAKAWQHTQGFGGWGWWGVLAGFVLTAVGAAAGSAVAVHWARGARRDFSRRSSRRSAAAA
jgi:hypothetical protein